MKDVRRHLSFLKDVRIVPPPLPKADAGLHEGASALLNPAELERFGDLLLFAQSKVEGYFSGKHRSPYYGSNAEFADYQEYTAGEDIAHMDWRVYGRTKKLFLRKYEEETDMAVYLIVDASHSMRYLGAGQEQKFARAGKIAAALAYLMIHQGDKVSLSLFAQKLTKFLPPGGTRRHLYNLVRELEAVKPQSSTGLDQALQECASVFRKRGRIVILSDFFGDLDRFFDALAQFIHRKYEVLLLQVLDPDELDLPKVDIARFVDMETGETVEVEPDEIRRGYRENMTRLTENIAAQADSRRVQYSLVETNEPYLSAIEAYLGFRAKTGRSR
jgi:uncharacterized protein (DUF58 family)